MSAHGLFQMNPADLDALVHAARQVVWTKADSTTLTTRMGQLGQELTKWDWLGTEVHTEQDEQREQDVRAQ